MKRPAAVAKNGWTPDPELLADYRKAGEEPCEIKEVLTREYEREYGHKPRGFGEWAFMVLGTNDLRAMHTPDSIPYNAPFWVRGYYSDALRLTKRFARQSFPSGICRIEVLT